MHGFHHVRARARMAEGLEPFPAKGAFKHFLDYLMYAVGIFAPLALVPQILQLYTSRSSDGLSLLTWLLLALFNVLWALYGAAHHDRQIFFANVLMVCFNLAIVVGILLY